MGKIKAEFDKVSSINASLVGEIYQHVMKRSMISRFRYPNTEAFYTLVKDLGVFKDSLSEVSRIHDGLVTFLKGIPSHSQDEMSFFDTPAPTETDFTQ